MAAASGIRRVVTTHDAGGKAIVGFDNIAPQTGGEAELGVKVFNLWITDQTPCRHRRQGRRRHPQGRHSAAAQRLDLPHRRICTDAESGRPRSEFPRQDRWT